MNNLNTSWIPYTFASGAENELTQQEEASTEEDIDEENSLEEDDEQMEEGKFVEK